MYTLTKVYFTFLCKIVLGVSKQHPEIYREDSK